MSNYKCFVAKIDAVMDIPNADRIHIASVLGESVVVSKEWGVGKVGLFFTSDTQLSDEFCKYNNLYRHGNLNRNPEKTGFFEDNRRVRCQPFLKIKSEGFFCEPHALAFCGENHYMDLTVGDSFTELNGYKVCEKYLSPQTLKAMNNIQKKKTKAQQTPMFHKHTDTKQFKHYANLIPKGALLGFHAKIHGTSSRNSYSKVIISPRTLWDKTKDFFGLFERESYQYLTGTRNVVLFDDQYKEGFHGSEQFRFDVMNDLKPHLAKGMTVYGEIAGYANQKPIMGIHSLGKLGKHFTKKYGKNSTYSYNCKEHEYRFHIYRISQVNDDGVELDYTNDQINAFCSKNGFNAPYNVHEPIIYDGDAESLIALVDKLTERPEYLTEDYIDPSHISEGIIVRVDTGNTTPTFYKSKSFAFKVCEGILKETGDVDLEEIS